MWVWHVVVLPCVRSCLRAWAGCGLWSLWATSKSSTIADLNWPCPPALTLTDLERQIADLYRPWSPLLCPAGRTRRCTWFRIHRRHIQRISSIILRQPTGMLIKIPLQSTQDVWLALVHLVNVNFGLYNYVYLVIIFFFWSLYFKVHVIVPFISLFSGPTSYELFFVCLFLFLFLDFCFVALVVQFSSLVCSKFTCFTRCF